MVSAFVLFSSFASAQKADPGTRPESPSTTIDQRPGSARSDSFADPSAAPQGAPDPNSKSDIATGIKQDEKAPLVDLNDATIDQLRKLNGIDDATAQRIIAGRPYADKKELQKKKILSRGAYKKIEGRVTANKK